MATGHKLQCFGSGKSFLAGITFAGNAGNHPREEAQAFTRLKRLFRDKHSCLYARACNN